VALHRVVDDRRQLAAFVMTDNIVWVDRSSICRPVDLVRHRLVFENNETMLQSGGDELRRIAGHEISRNRPAAFVADQPQPHFGHEKTTELCSLSMPRAAATSPTFDPPELSFFGHHRKGDRLCPNVSGILAPLRRIARCDRAALGGARADNASDWVHG
jgi:hypothetical protein